VPSPTLGVGGPSVGSIDPIIDLDHPKSFSAIIGGYSYRGPVVALRGRYLFGVHGETALYEVEVRRNVEPVRTVDGRTAYPSMVARVSDITAEADQKLAGRR